MLYESREMTITLLVFVILICLSYCEFSKVESHHDIVECVFAINANSTIVVSPEMPYCFRMPKQMLQNIGKINVRATSTSKDVILEPGEKKKFHSQVAISTINMSNKNRALVYASKCDKNCHDYIENPDEGYDRNKILSKTFALGVKHFPNYENVEDLIRAFWLDDNNNVWEQIYAVIKDLLDVNTQQMISTILNKDIPSIKKNIIELNNLTENRINFNEKFNEVITKLRYIEKRFILADNHMFNLYLIPLYTNIVTLKLYLYKIGLDINKEYFITFRKTCICVQEQLLISINKSKKIAEIALAEIYNTVYAGALYNVMMNARSHIAIHIFEIFPKWNAVLSKCEGYELTDQLRYAYPISYSNLYGRATPDLLQQAINIQDSILIGQCVIYPTFSLTYLYSIFVYITEFNGLKTVYGLKLTFLSHTDSEYSHCLGTCENTKYEKLDLPLKKIIKLKVYKSKYEYIRCLEFSLSDSSTKIFGNHCEDNSTNFEFELEGHYIHSLYLANDYPETDEYFDNVAVSYFPLG